MEKYPEWAEERFGNNIPEWAEERWSSEDEDGEYDFDDYEAY